MAVSTVTIGNPPDGVQLPNNIVRPAVSYSWTGGVGPFNSTVTWDDDPTFGNANGVRQIVNETSITSPYTSVPTADLGNLTHGHVWYIKVRVTDTNDSGFAEDTNNDFTYFDPKLEHRFLYAQANVGVGILRTDEPVPTQIISIDATSGTFTVSFDGVGPSASIGFNDTAGNVKSAIEGLSNVTTVTVTKIATQKWLVRLDDVSPSPIPAFVINTGGLSGGGATGSAVEYIDDADPWGTGKGGTAGPDGDPRAQHRFLYGLANVGVGFTPIDDPDGPGLGGWGETIGGTIGPDGNARNFNRFLYGLANVGVGFDPIDRPAGGWGETIGGTVGPDGINRNLNRYLYQQANVTSTQPCPFIFSLSTTTIRTGESLTVTGQGLVSASSPTADAYDAEVRLYETASHAAAYTVLTTSSYTAGETQDSISVTIPGGASSGFVAVVHTTGATCSGSNFKALTVIAKEPDRDAGWWIEVWNLRNSATVVTPVPNVYEASFEQVRNDIGKGSITVPANHPDLTDIIDRDSSPPVQRLVKVYLHGRFAYAFIPFDKSDPWIEDEAARVRLYGDGQEGMLRWGRCLWKDFPAQPSSARTWQYGSSENQLPAGDMDPDSNATNGDLEDAVVTPWIPVGTSTLFAGTSVPRSGSYSLEITPAANGDGAYLEYGVEAGWRVYVDVYVKDPIASGDDITVDLIDINGSTVVATQTLTPTTAAWNKVTLTYVPATGGTGRIRVRYTDATGTPHLFIVDDVAAYGNPGFGGGFSIVRATASISRTYVAAGLHSLQVDANSGGDVSFNGYIDTFPVEANRDYVFSAAVTGTAGKVVRIGLRLGGVLDQTDVTLTGLGTWDVVTLNGTAGSDEDTGRYAVSSVNSTAETFWIDAVSVTPGQPATTAGEVVVDVHTAMAARGTLDFVQLDFDGVLDSNGNPWPEVVSIEVQPEWTLWDLLEKLIGYGYDVEYAPTNFRAGGDSGWTLRMFGPNGLGTDWSSVPDGPAILPDESTRSVDPSSAPPPATVVYAEGVDGIWSATAADAGTLTNLERREEFVTNRSAADATTLFRSASHRLDVSLSRGGQVSVGFTGNSDPLPYFDFLIADRMRAHIPKDGRDLVPDAVYKVAAIAANLTAVELGLEFQVDLGSYRLAAERIRDQVISSMLRRDGVENYQPGTGSIREIR